jgi:YegS/Rv2252/BmrU family lipid kinase
MDPHPPTGTSAPAIVINPMSAGGETRRRWPEVEAALRDALGEFRPLFTERRGHATELARTALREGARMVVAVGGDGTLNEVMNGFFEDDRPVAPEAVLGILPLATGGDFIKTVGTSRKLAEAAHTLAHGTPRTIDIGRLQYVQHDGTPAQRYFINIASFGIGGLVDRYVNQSHKLLSGKASFFLATVRASLHYKNARCRITLDDGPAIQQPIYVVAVSNGRFFGGGMKIAPDAEMDDGQFDVVTIGDVSMMSMILHSSRIYRGTHIGLPQVAAQRARKVVAEPVDAGVEVLLDVDGEAPGRLPATFELLPRALRIQV